ncbi:MAG: mechanosensitive ion channel domain-containing protein [Planctomycetota bacterium]|nr:mechanosensitive ion channel domain-containing protein [Planctomycetota bacterium]
MALQTTLSLWTTTVAQAKPQWALDLQQWLGDNPWMGASAAFGALLVLSILAWLVTWMLVLPLLRRLIKKTSFAWDDTLLDASVFRWLGYIPSAVVFALASEILDAEVYGVKLPSQVEGLVFLQDLAQAFIVICFMMAINAALSATLVIFRQRNQDQQRASIKSYIQLLKIFVVIVGLVAAAAIATGKDPWEFLKYIAGMTAVLLFVFKDTILSLVASVQLTSNKMLRVGDWVEVPSCGADGDVIDVALHTVQIQNFDKTIVTVPTRTLVDGAFKNWRGMSESGGRRIKRDIVIDMSTIRFLTPAEIEQFGKITLISEYIAEKKSKLHGSSAAVDETNPPINVRRLTNVGTFRAYIEAYLKSLPSVHGKFTFLVRQLQPGQTGLPIQIYIFTNITAWVEYEAIQADIFDHLLAALGDFGLRVFQEPTGHDVTHAGAPAANQVAGP